MESFSKISFDDAVTVSGWIVGPVLGFFFGLKLQKDTEKRAAKHELIATVSRFLHDIEQEFDVPNLHRQRKDELSRAVLGFSSRLKPSKRIEIELIWKEYQEIKNYQIKHNYEGKENISIPLLSAPLKKLIKYVDAA